MMPAGKLSSPNRRQLLVAGLCGAPLFVLSVIVFGLLNPGYSHAHRAVSRLGGMDAPLFWAFDLIGLFVPGLLVAGVAIELRRAEHEAGLVTWSSAGLVWFGFMHALTAIPADFHRMFESPWTWAHAFFAIVPSFLFFSVIRGCGRSLSALGAPRWRVRAFRVLGYLPIAEFLLYGVLTESPGLVQRLMIVTILTCVAWLGWTLMGVLRPGRGTRCVACPNSR